MTFLNKNLNNVLNVHILSTFKANYRMKNKENIKKHIRVSNIRIELFIVSMFGTRVNMFNLLLWINGLNLLTATKMECYDRKLAFVMA